MTVNKLIHILITTAKYMIGLLERGLKDGEKSNNRDKRE